MVIARTQDVHADKRHLPRWEVATRVLYLLDNEFTAQETLSRNLSCAGICLTASEYIPVNRKIRLKIYLTESTVVLADGQVVWSKSESGHNLAGVKFSDISLKSQELILEHAFEIRRADMVKYWFQGWDKKQLAVSCHLNKPRESNVSHGFFISSLCSRNCALRGA